MHAWRVTRFGEPAEALTFEEDVPAFEPGPGERETGDGQ